MTMTNEKAFDLMYRFLQGLQDDNAIDIGPVLDELNRLEQIVVKQEDPYPRMCRVVLLHDVTSSDPVSVECVEMLPFAVLDSDDETAREQVQLLENQVQQSLEQEGFWHDEMWLETVEKNLQS